jgi:CHAD domain-containing protein
MELHAAGRAVGTILEELSARLEKNLLAAIADEDDAVHQARVTIRRVRSVLQVYRPVLRGKRAKRLRNSFKELGWELGEARDLEVMARRADELVTGADGGGLADAYWSRYRERHNTLARHLNGHEVAALCARLRTFAAQPLRSGTAALDAQLIFPGLLCGSLIVVLGDAEGIGASAGLERQEALHTLRKAARRTRYAAEAAGPFLREDQAEWTARIAEVGERLQGLIGDHRDDTAFAARIDDVAAAEPARAGELAELSAGITRRAAAALRPVNGILGEVQELLDPPPLRTKAAL